MNTKFILPCLCILFFAANISAQVKNQPLLFARIINSPRAVGMGGISANLVDAQSALYNPGAFGVFSLDNNFSLSLPNNTKWLEQLADDLHLQTWSVGGGYSHIKSNQDDKTQFKYAIGLSYSERILDYGRVSRMDQVGNPLDSFYPKDQINSYTIAFGIDYKIQIGIGYSLKKYSTDDQLIMVGGPLPSTETTGNMYDFGLLIEFPLHELFQLVPSNVNNMSFEMTPSLSFVKSNLGDNIGPVLIGGAAQPPKARKFGFGLNLYLLYNAKNYISFQFVYEKERDLVVDKDLFTRKGLEFGLMNTIFLRSGNVEDLIYTDSDYSSYGIGFSLRGLLTAFHGSNSNDNTTDTMGYILKNIDVNFDWAKINEESSLLDDTKFMKLSITI